MNGVIVIDKPQGFTSFDVVAVMRRACGQKKIGHTGTLDPMATGVLPVLFGRATRAADLLPSGQKRYRAKALFGVVTDTGDVTGTVLSDRRPVSLTEEQIRAALPAFTGEIRQTPPMYSAVKVGGRRLYDLARAGKEIERPQRSVTVHLLQLLGYDPERGEAELDVLCSKGTYVRSLVMDLGQALGPGAALSGLRRTMSNGFSAGDCLTLDEAVSLAREGALEERLVPLGEAFSALVRLDVGEWQAKMLKNGVRLSLPKLGNPESGVYAVWSGGEFLGLGTADRETGAMTLKQF